MTVKNEQPQPKDLSTGERLAMTGRAVVQGFVHKLKGEHETEDGGRYTVDAGEVEGIIDAWPAAQKNVARQMLAKYGMPNEATPTKLFWYRNGPWKRTVLTSEVVVHNWPTIHSDFLTQVIDYRVPPDKFSAVAEFDGRARSEFGNRCRQQVGQRAARKRIVPANALRIELLSGASHQAAFDCAASDAKVLPSSARRLSRGEGSSEGSLVSLA